MTGSTLNRRIVGYVFAAVVVGGISSAVVPQHVGSIARVVAVATAVVAGALVLGAVGPFVSREPQRTALDARPLSGAPPLDPHGLRDARRDLDRPCPPGSVPAPVWERLVLAWRMQCRASGAEIDGTVDDAGGDARLRPETCRVLATPPAAGFDRDPARAAALVHRTLDELSTLDRPTGAPHGSR